MYKYEIMWDKPQRKEKQKALSAGTCSLNEHVIPYLKGIKHSVYFLSHTFNVPVKNI